METEPAANALHNAEARSLPGGPKPPTRPDPIGDIIALMPRRRVVAMKWTLIAVTVACAANFFFHFFGYTVLTQEQLVRLILPEEDSRLESMLFVARRGGIPESFVELLLTIDISAKVGLLIGLFCVIRSVFFRLGYKYGVFRGEVKELYEFSIIGAVGNCVILAYTGFGVVAQDLLTRGPAWLMVSGLAFLSWGMLLTALMPVFLFVRLPIEKPIDPALTQSN
jgi:hypothetical protein